LAEVRLLSALVWLVPRLSFLAVNDRIAAVSWFGRLWVVRPKALKAAADCGAIDKLSRALADYKRQTRSG